MTRNLSQAKWTLRINKEVKAMNDAACPWCETAIELAADDAAEQQCPECLTTWCYEDTTVELALAA